MNKKTCIFALALLSVDSQADQIFDEDEFDQNEDPFYESEEEEDFGFGLTTQDLLESSITSKKYKKYPLGSFRGDEY